MNEFHVGDPRSVRRWARRRLAASTATQSRFAPIRAAARGHRARLSKVSAHAPYKQLPSSSAGSYGARAMVCANHTSGDLLVVGSTICPPSTPAARLAWIIGCAGEHRRLCTRRRGTGGPLGKGLCSAAAMPFRRASMRNSIRTVLISPRARLYAALDARTDRFPLPATCCKRGFECGELRRPRGSGLSHPRCSAALLLTALCMRRTFIRRPHIARRLTGGGFPLFGLTYAAHNATIPDDSVRGFDRPILVTGTPSSRCVAKVAGRMTWINATRVHADVSMRYRSELRRHGATQRETPALTIGRFVACLHQWGGVIARQFRLPSSRSPPDMRDRPFANVWCVAGVP